MQLGIAVGFFQGSCGISITVIWGRAVFGGVGETLEHQWAEACFLKNAQVSAMAKQGLRLT